jgi:DNA mismatch endonuclease (patch repair protein)
MEYKPGQYEKGSSTCEPLPSPEKSAMMRLVRSKNTQPERAVRSLVHALGYRFRLHRRDLPGTPDLVFPGNRKIIFVNGCFWHRHSGCPRASTPKTRSETWKKKFDANIARDKANLAELEAAGWQVLTIWECEISNQTALRRSLDDFLGHRSLRSNLGINTP